MNITRRKNEWSRLLRDGKLDECRRITRHFFRRRDMMMGELEEALLGLKDSPALKDEQLKLVRLIRRELERDDETLAVLRSLVGLERPTSDSGEAAAKDAEPRDFYTYRFYKGEETNPYAEDEDFSRHVFWDYEKALATSPALQWVARYLFDNTCPSDWPDFIKDACADAPAREMALMMFEDFNRHRRGGTAREKRDRCCFGIDDAAVKWKLYFKEETNND